MKFSQNLNKIWTKNDQLIIGTYEKIYIKHVVFDEKIKIPYKILDGNENRLELTDFILKRRFFFAH